MQKAVIKPAEGTAYVEAKCKDMNCLKSDPKLVHQILFNFWNMKVLNAIFTNLMFSFYIIFFIIISFLKFHFELIVFSLEAAVQRMANHEVIDLKYNNQCNEISHLVLDRCIFVSLENLDHDHHLYEERHQ